MPEKYQRPVRKVQGPVILVGRQMRPGPVDGEYRDLPMNRMSLEQRNGMLDVLFVPGVLQISGSEQHRIYPYGAQYRYDGGCGISVEVLPRGQSARRYEEMIKRPPYTERTSYMQWLKGCHTPVIVSREADVENGPSAVFTGRHLTLVSSRQLRQYLQGVLPYIGLDPRDASDVIRYVEAKLEAGRRKLTKP